MNTQRENTSVGKEKHFSVLLFFFVTKKVELDYSSNASSHKRIVCNAQKSDGGDPCNVNRLGPAFSWSITPCSSEIRMERNPLHEV